MAIFAKVISLFFALLVISKTYYDYKKKQEGLFTFLFWICTWLGIVYVAFDSNRFFDYFQNASSQNVGFGTIFGIAFVFLFFVTYRIYIKANRLERKMQDIVMKIGLKEIDND